MDTSTSSLIKILVPRVPMIGKTALSHTLGFSEQSSKWDLRTAMIVNLIRSLIIDTPPRAISKTQKMSLKDPGVKGRMWISRVTMPKPEDDDLRQSLFSAIEALKEPGEAAGEYQKPEMLPVEAEWTGYREGATESSTELNISEEEKYKEMMKEAASPTTVLYFHGGAYYLMDPASHRPTCKKIAKITRGRCLNVRYRLAPQAAFPSQLLDALVSYFTLLYPPPNSLHTAVSPNNIVFAGDSAGGNLSLVLLQTLLQFRRQGLKPFFNGKKRDVPLPAGVATCSAWADITHSSPSCETNRHYDYLPSRDVVPEEGPTYPACEIWPSKPPRKNVYADDAVLCHPLVSPIIAKSWEGSPPMYIETGQELLTDEDKHVACKAARQGVVVMYEEYEAMPHCFAMVLEGLPASKLFFDRWAGVIGRISTGGTVKTSGKRIFAKSLKEESVDVEGLSEFKDEEVRGRMEARVKKMTIKHSGTIAKL